MREAILALGLWALVLMGCHAPDDDIGRRAVRPAYPDALAAGQVRELVIYLLPSGLACTEEMVSQANLARLDAQAVMRRLLPPDQGVIELDQAGLAVVVGLDESGRPLLVGCTSVEEGEPVVIELAWLDPPQGADGGGTDAGWEDRPQGKDMAAEDGLDLARTDRAPAQDIPPPDAPLDLAMADLAPQDTPPQEDVPTGNGEDRPTDMSQSVPDQAGPDGTADMSEDRPPQPDIPCLPHTCSSLAKGCDTWDDGCGGSIACGECSEGSCLEGLCVSPVASVGLGMDHACAVREDGTLWCWGSNREGQLGLGAEDDDTHEPERVGQEADWLLVEAGEEHSCAIKQDGSLWCWGSNSHTQLGIGSYLEAPAPARVGSGTDWLSLDLGGRHTCAIKINGSLWCWGYDGDGQIGTSSGCNNSRCPMPARVTEEADWRAVALGDRHTCGLRLDGSLWCWGASDRGQAGADGVEEIHLPTRVGGATDWEILAGAANGRHSCAIKDDSTLWCWGANSYGQLGLEDTADRYRPEQVGQDEGWSGLSLGGSYYEGYSCAIKGDGTLWCWGYNDHGQLGQGGVTERHWPVPCEGEGWRAVAAGVESTCAIGGDGFLWCWGNGRLSDPEIPPAPYVPQVVPANVPWEGVDLGGGDYYSAHVCAIRADGGLWCWGSNSHGQLGVEDGSHATMPLLTGGDHPWRQVSAAAGRTCAIRGEGTLWCWGDGFDSFDAMQQGPYGDWVTVASGSSYQCAIREEGTLWCWGDNYGGQLGLGDKGNRVEPTLVGSDWRTVAAADAHTSGDYHTCGIRIDGSLWCWGSNTSGQLGLGDRDERPGPERVGEAVWRGVTVGDRDTCGIRGDGTLWCWGDNRSGQLGLGDTRARLAPTQVGQDDDWAQGEAGYSHTCAVKGDGALWCWGSNHAYQLGLAEEGDYLRPEPVGEGWRAVGVSERQTCGVKHDGTLWCWGEGAPLSDRKDQLLPVPLGL